MKKLTKKVLLACRKLPLLIETKFDKNFLATDVPISIVTVCLNECRRLERTLRNIRENKNEYQKYYIFGG